MKLLGDPLGVERAQDMSWIASGALLAGTTESFEAAVRNYASKLGWLRFNVSAERSFGPRLDTSEHGARA